MSEVERDLPERRPRVIPFRQGLGHGPVYLEVPTAIIAWCVEPGCGFRGPERPPWDVAGCESDADDHLKDVEHPSYAPSGLDEFAEEGTP